LQQDRSEPPKNPYQEVSFRQENIFSYILHLIKENQGDTIINLLFENFVLLI